MKRYIAALVLAVIAGLGVGACVQETAPVVPSPSANLWLDWRTIADCQQEDGTGIDQEYPCKWDSRVRGCQAPGAVDRTPICASAKPDPDVPPVLIFADPSECVMFDLAPAEVRTEILCAGVLYGEPIE